MTRNSKNTRISRRSVLTTSASAAAMSLVSGTGAAFAQAEPADLVLLNGRITTMDPDRPDATALATKDGVFIAVGSEADIRPLIG
ncbi:MAG: amidohydrolase, partial [Pseudomonadota bacterium]